MKSLRSVPHGRSVFFRRIRTEDLDDYFFLDLTIAEDLITRLLSSSYATYDPKLFNVSAEAVGLGLESTGEPSNFTYLLAMMKDGESTAISVSGTSSHFPQSTLAPNSTITQEPTSIYTQQSSFTPSLSSTQGSDSIENLKL